MEQVMNDKFNDTSDDELIGRLSTLVTKYEKVAPELVPLLKEWGRLKNEISVITEEVQKRELDV